VTESYYVYVIELFNIVFPRKIRKKPRKCISYRGNSAINLVNQGINNVMYCWINCIKKITPLYLDMMIRNIKVT
jgi:hypothetical protein